MCETGGKIICFTCSYFNDFINPVAENSQVSYCASPLALPEELNKDKHTLEKKPTTFKALPLIG